MVYNFRPKNRKKDYAEPPSDIDADEAEGGSPAAAEAGAGNPDAGEAEGNSPEAGEAGRDEGHQNDDGAVYCLRNGEYVIHGYRTNPNPSRPKVIEYLAKKGYTRTEATLRMESLAQDPDSRPLASRVENQGGRQWLTAMALLENWIDGSLDIYKSELQRLLWPVFVYSFLESVQKDYPNEAKELLRRYETKFEIEHTDDLRKLRIIALPEHVSMSNFASLYHANKYRVTLSEPTYFQLISFLEGKEKEGGSVILTILNTCMTVFAVKRAQDSAGLAGLLSKAKLQSEFPAEDEGIPGHNPGSGNLNSTPGSSVLTKLKLGPLPIEPELLEDVMAELEEADQKNPPKDGQNSLLQEFNHMIKREDTDDAPARADLPLPPSRARDVMMEVLRVKEHRDRFKIEPSGDGAPTGVSVCMFTFHNAYLTINCISVSDDNQMIAVGTSDSYIRVWTVDGKPLQSLNEGEQPVASRRLIGHSAPVFNVSFSPAIDNAARGDAKHFEPPHTVPLYLLSCSSDKTIKLWSLGVWQCLVSYKGHLGPVWDVQWGPFGHYFLTCSQDKQAHLFSTEHVAPIRTFVGHDSGVDAVAFHPNGCYTFTAGADRTVRMWQVSNAMCVRLFTGHTGYITAMACAPNGKVLATADDQGTIVLWDLGPGRLLKRMRGHDKGGIWSVSWSAESTALISGGNDGTVRVWDVNKRLDAPGQGKIVGEGGAGQKVDAGAGPSGAQAGPSTSGRKKGKARKGVVVTPDQTGVFPTKKSPVKYVKFTRMNLAVASGVYQG